MTYPKTIGITVHIYCVADKHSYWPTLSLFDWGPLAPVKPFIIIFSKRTLNLTCLEYCFRWLFVSNPTFCPLLLATPQFPYVPESRIRVLNWPPLEMTKSRTCHPHKMAESPTLMSLWVASSGLCHFLRVASPGPSHFRGWPFQDSVFFWILAHWEIWGWQEGSETLNLFFLV